MAKTDFYFSTIPTKLNAQARWRRSLCQKFPDDHRNSAAAQELERLAGATFDQVNPEIWERLQPYVAEPRFSEVLNEASRQIGFKSRPADINAFLETLASLAELGGAQ